MGEKPDKKAVSLFDSGYNCAESVLLALSQHFHQESRAIPRIATAMGAGIGRMGQICGALSGAIMTIGLIKGCDKAEEENEKRGNLYVEVQQLIKAFEKEFGSSQCKELTQCDFLTPKGTRKFRQEQLRKNLCPKFVAWCAEYIADKYR